MPYTYQLLLFTSHTGKNTLVYDQHLWVLTKIAKLFFNSYRQNYKCIIVLSPADKSLVHLDSVWVLLFKHLPYTNVLEVNVIRSTLNCQQIKPSKLFQIGNSTNLAVLFLINWLPKNTLLSTDVSKLKPYLYNRIQLHN